MTLDANNKYKQRMKLEGEEETRNKHVEPTTKQQIDDLRFSSLPWVEKYLPQLFMN